MSEANNKVLTEGQVFTSKIRLFAILVSVRKVSLFILLFHRKMNSFPFHCIFCNTPYNQYMISFLNMVIACEKNIFFLCCPVGFCIIPFLPEPDKGKFSFGEWLTSPLVLNLRTASLPIIILHYAEQSLLFSIPANFQESSISRLTIFSILVIL